MPEPSSPESLATLAGRWERDKSSRLFLQLAEEYRRAGRTADAIAVLADGLGHHPSSVAGLVAMGRCQIEAGDVREATQVLEQALELDPAQLVASKLLAEAWIRLGNAERASGRLATYRLFNEHDPEIEELEQRIRELEGGSDAPTPEHGQPPGGEAFGRAIFDLSSPAATTPTLAFLARTEGRPQPVTSGRPDPFPELFDRAEAERRIVARLATEAVFSLPAGPAAGDLQGAASAASGSEARVEPEVEAPQPMFSLQSIGAEVEQETLEPAVRPAVAATGTEPAEERTASATLAALYLQQGHLDDAEIEYRAVLAASPADVAARSGLARIEELRSGSATLAPGSRPAEPAGGSSFPGAGLSQRKIAALSRWLKHLRQARRG